ncbi:MAG TPA: hypothetical protein VFD23_06770 [Clostridia bacterium]|nr:hypothetical protein [Clostridia bacterium]
MKKRNKLGFLALLMPLVMVALIAVPIFSFATPPAAVGLGTTSTFAVLAGQSITNTGPTVITGGLPEGGGNIGVHPGSGHYGARRYHHDRVDAARCRCRCEPSEG